MISQSIVKNSPSINLLKLLAMVFMTVDHVGLFFFPNQIGWRMVGRLAAPIFTYLIVEGMNHTHHLTRYIWRLVTLALISQLVFYWTIGSSSLNIIFNFLLLIAFIMSNWPGRLLVSLVYLVVDIEYGPFILLLGLIYYFAQSRYAKIASSVMVSLGFGLWLAVENKFQNIISATQIFAVFASPIIFIAQWIQPRLNNFKWLNRQWPRWLFYAYYPTHWLILFGIRLLVKGML